MITGTMRRTPEKVLGTLMNVPQLSTVVKHASLAARYRLSRTNQGTLKTKHNQGSQ